MRISNDQNTNNIPFGGEYITADRDVSVFLKKDFFEKNTMEYYLSLVYDLNNESLDEDKKKEVEKKPIETQKDVDILGITVSEYKKKVNDIEKSNPVYLSPFKNKITPHWHIDEWYKNPSSGRSNSWSSSDESGNLSTTTNKGGDFLFNSEIRKNKFDLNRFYGGEVYQDLKNEYQNALYLQELSLQKTGKLTWCPQPQYVSRLDSIRNENKEIVSLEDFFKSFLEKDNEEFIKLLLWSASSLGVDTSIPLSENASKEIKDNPFKWVLQERLNKYPEGVYQYKIIGPNTRIIDLMSDPENMEDPFKEALKVETVEEGIFKFAQRIGEFYGFLHGSCIGSKYHSTCLLADTTIAGISVDIGDLEKAVATDSEDFFTRIFGCREMLHVLNKIFKKDIEQEAFSVFKNAYVEKFKEFNEDDFDLESWGALVFDKNDPPLRTKFLHAVTQKPIISEEFLSEIGYTDKQ